VNLDETTKLCKAIATIAPAQKFEPDTPAFWCAILTHVRYEDAREAVIDLAQRQPFIAPADITAAVKALRSRRLEGVDRLGHLAETPAQWREIIRRVADGELEVPPLALDQAANQEAIRAAIENVFPRPPRPRSIDYTPKAPAPAPSVDPDRADVHEAERRRPRRDELADL
jgi:hypothetical protein